MLTSYLILILFKEGSVKLKTGLEGLLGALRSAHELAREHEEAWQHCPSPPPVLH
jgi:hypothetical protein